MIDNSSDNTLDDLVRLRTNKRHETHNRVDPDEVVAKVIEDINFLRGRINHIKRAALSPRTPTILATYESMLKSRESVLSWLQDDVSNSDYINVRAN